jgi:amino acid transporter
VLALISGFANLATLSAMARMVTYAGAALSLIVLRKKIPSPDTFRLPGGSMIPILTILLSLFLLTGASRAQWNAGIVAIVVGLGLYLTTKITKHHEEKIFIK